jgi:hypothetical protein
MSGKRRELTPERRRILRRREQAVERAEQRLELARGRFVDELRAAADEGAGLRAIAEAAKVSHVHVSRLLEQRRDGMTRTD